MVVTSLEVNEVQSLDTTLAVELQFQTYKEIKDAIKSKNDLPFHIISEGNKYIVIENDEGYRAYMELESFRPHDRLDHAFRFAFATRHNQEVYGWYISTLPLSSTMDEIIRCLNETLECSKMQFLYGEHPMLYIKQGVRYK